MPDIRFAAADVTAMKLGTTTVTKVMYGTTEIWPGVAPWTGPVIATTSTEVGTSMGTANPIPAPAGVAVGNLLIAFASCDTTTVNISPSTGWWNINHGRGNGHTFGTFARIADGTASDALALTSATQDYCAVILRITGHGGVMSTLTTDLKTSDGTATSTSTTPDPPSLNAGSVKNWLWLAGCAVDFADDATITAPPSGYTTVVNLSSAAGSSSPSRMAVASRNLSTQTEDPGGFTISTSRPWRSVTVAVPPAP